MKRVDLLITEARQQSETTEFTSETGVQDAEFLRAMNDAQDRIQSLILNAYPRMFQKTKEIDAVADQEQYDFPVDLFMDSRVEKIDFSPNGDDRSYYKLDEGVIDEQINCSSGNPSYYIRESKTFLSQPPPQASAGKFRVKYQRALPKLDKRRGRVSAVTLDSGTNQITSLTLDPTGLTADDISAMNEAEFLTVVSKVGVVKMKSIPITEVNSSTGDVTVETFEYEDGETIAVGDYVCAGGYHTTHSQLPDIAERYLLRFAIFRTQKRDSSSDSIAEDKEVKEMEGDIVQSYSQASADVQGIPILDDQYLYSE